MTRTLLACLLLSAFAFAQSDNRHYLRSGWQIQSGCAVKADGDIVSTSTFRPHEWLPATVPTTVLAAQVAAGLYPDPYFGMNLRNIPGNNSHPIQKMFAVLPMPTDSPYACPWWYRTEFTAPSSIRGHLPYKPDFWLHFAGLNYRANIWLNGQKIGDAQQIAGMWREFEFNVTKELKPKNVLAIEVFAQKENDLGITFVDWNPMPPDKDMGLYRPVWLEESRDFQLSHPFVTSALSDDRREARLTATVEITNPSDQEKTVDVSVTGKPAASFAATKSVTLKAHETSTVELDATTSSSMIVKNPHLWWPYGMGSQEMYTAKFFTETADDHGVGVAGTATVRFAIRSVTSELTPEGHRLFKVNGKNFLVRGAGWTPDLMLRQTPQRLQAEMNYARDMHLNTLRLEGKLETDQFFDLADRMGIMIMAGWCCCDQWEKWEQWTPENHTVAAASLADEIRRLRNHPSLLVWLNGSDNPPPADVEQKYIEVLQQYRWPNPYISSATAKPTTVTGDSGVKMTGPYEWVPPMYWTADKNQHGGGWGFNTETSPGAAVPVAESIRHMFPQPSWWPQDDVWSYHAGLGNFKNLDIYNAALAARYGASKTLEDYTRKSQAAAYDGERAMFEAYIRNRYTSTGVIQWMYNNAWPGLIWHLYDYFLVPGGGYFGTKKANEPIHVIYGYDDRSVRVSNLTQQPADGLLVTARVLNFDMTEKFSRSVTIDAAADSVANALAIPELDDLSTTYFLDLVVTGARGGIVSRNFYWLSTRPDVLDWANSKFFYTPETQSGDLSQLGSLPKVKLQTVRVAPGAPDRVAPGAAARRAERRSTAAAPEAIALKVTNPSKFLAFQVRLHITDGPGGDEIMPVRWDDNYLSLLPGESQTVTAGFDPGALAGKHPVVHVDGWNVEPAVVR